MLQGVNQFQSQFIYFKIYDGDHLSFEFTKMFYLYPLEKDIVVFPNSCTHYFEDQVKNQHINKKVNVCKTGECTSLTFCDFNKNT